MSKTFGENPHKDVAIDRLHLEEECEIQPSSHLFYGEALAQAKTAVTKAQNRLEVVLGQRELQIRRHPPEDVKLTEPSIVALLSQDTEVQDAKEALCRAEAERNILSAQSAAMDQRGRSLDQLVTLWTKEYYNNRNKTDESSDALRDKLNSRNGKE